MKILLNSEPFLDQLSEKENKICVVDGGARGRLFPPFDRVDERILFVVKFDPDKDADISKVEDGLVVNGALWNTEEEIDLHVANRPSVSSVYPPNEALIELLWRNNKTMIEARKTKKIVRVNGVTLDGLVEKGTIPKIDFIKLDIHSAEYECMMGALQCLRSSVLGVLAETWSMPLHRGQKLHSDFEQLMNANNFYIFNILKTGASQRSNGDVTFNRDQPFKFDSLFFNEFMLSAKVPDKQMAMKAIGIADLFGYYGYAMQLNDFFREEDVLDQNTHKHCDKFLRSQNDLFVKYAQKVVNRLSLKLSRYFF